MTSALTATVNHLFVGQNSAQSLAPPNGHLTLIGQTLFIELGKNPLCPAHILRVGRVDLALPVIAQAECPQLLAEVIDIFLCRNSGMRASLNRILLSGQTKSVPAHGVQHIKTTMPFIAGKDVSRGVALGVADMQTRARWVGKHIKHIKFGLRYIKALIAWAKRAEGCVVEPAFLPARLNCRKVVGSHGSKDFTLPPLVTGHRTAKLSAPMRPRSLARFVTGP